MILVVEVATLMKRRTFIQASMAAPVQAAQPAPRMPVLDYGRSFLAGVAPWNRVRFWIESRTRVIDERTGKQEDFLQCAACKSENTFAPKDLLQKDNYDFTPIFGPEFGVIFRRKAYLNPNYREVRKAAAMWDGQTHQLREAAEARALSSTASIRKATHEGRPLVAQTEIFDQSARLRAILEYPVKTMNIHDEKDIYQVDTGPVALPDLTRRQARLADSISLAFVAFNAPHFADFVIEDPTPIIESGREVTRVHHYSRLLTLRAENRLYAL